MALRDSFLKVCSQYLAAKSESFTGHPIAKLLRSDLPDELAAALERMGFRDYYDPRGSAGQGRWVECPWLAILDPAVTDTPQKKYYPVYLFREDMTGFYLSLNQGMTEAKEEYHSDAKEALRGRAADYRNRLGKINAAFSVKAIDLRPADSSNDSAFYECGNVCAKLYEAHSVPEEAMLLADLAEMLRLYSTLAELIDGVGSAGPEDDEEGNPFIEDYTAFRYHKRIERNPKIAAKVKRLHGYVCEACNFDFEAFYPGIDKRKYIEAHHLIPISTLKGKKATRDPKTDFAVLCANCHRMIHRFEKSNDLAAFRATMKAH